MEHGIEKLKGWRFDMAKKKTEAELIEFYKGVPHFDLIVKDGYIEIPSIFMFKECQMEYYPFLQACKEFNCTVRLANEDMTISPDDDDTIRHIKEMFYFQMVQCPQMVEQYIKYLLNKESMTWGNVQGVHEPILGVGE